MVMPRVKGASPLLRSCCDFVVDLCRCASPLASTPFPFGPHGIGTNLQLQLQDISTWGEMDSLPFKGKPNVAAVDVEALASQCDIVIPTIR